MNDHLLAVQHYQKGEIDRALELFRRHVARHPEDPQAHIHIGVILEQRDELREAIACYRRAVQLKPDPSWHLNLARVCSKLRHEGGDALEAEHYLAAIELSAGCGDAWRGLSSLRLHQGDFSGAADAAQRAVEIDPADPRAHFQVGLVQLFHGESGAARDSFARSNDLAVARWDDQLVRPGPAARRSWFSIPPDPVLHSGGSEDRIYGRAAPQVLRAPSWQLPCLRYREQSSYRVTLRNVRLEGLQGLVYDDTRVFASEHVMIQGVWRFFTESPPRHPRSTTTFADLVSLHQPDITNYYHWTAECLARLLILEDLLDRDRSLPLLVPRVRAPGGRGASGEHFIEQYLRLLGIDASRCVASQAGPGQVLFAERLHYADWQHPLSARPASELAAVWYPPRTLLRRVRERLAPAAASAERRLVIYAARRDPRAARFVHNEDRLLEALRSIAGEDLLVMGDRELPVSQQIARFRQARLVIGPHGAGLTNILFCAPGTKVIEFPVVPAVLNHYAHLSMALDLDYWLVPQVATHYQGSYVIDDRNLPAIREVVSACLR